MFGTLPGQLPGTLLLLQRARTRHTVAHQLDTLPARTSVVAVVLHYGVTCLLGLLALLVTLTSASAK